MCWKRKRSAAVSVSLDIWAARDSASVSAEERKGLAWWLQLRKKGAQNEWVQLQTGNNVDQVFTDTHHFLLMEDKDVGTGGWVDVWRSVTSQVFSSCLTTTSSDIKDFQTSDVSFSFHFLSALVRKGEMYRIMFSPGALCWQIFRDLNWIQQCVSEYLHKNCLCENSQSGALLW